jgi:hypothetical protein
MNLEPVSAIAERTLLMEKPAEELVDLILNQQSTIKQLLEEIALKGHRSGGV